MQGIKKLNMDNEVELTDNISEADVLLALQSKLKKNLGIQATAKSHDKLVYATKVFFPMFQLLYPSSGKCFDQGCRFLADQLFSASN